MHKTPKRRMSTRYFPNREVTVGEYKISINRTGAVYQTNCPGHRKLDSMFIGGALHVVLPNEETVEIIQNEKGELEEKKIVKTVPVV